MTTFVLVRHGSRPWLGKELVGRRPGVHLSSEGQQEVRTLARRLRGCIFDALYTSPLERCRETASLLGDAIQQSPQELPEVTEIDFGRWTGMSFPVLEPDPAWQKWNTARGSAVPPSGESMTAVQERFVSALSRLQIYHPDGVVGIVSHGDVIKAGLLELLGIPLDLHTTIDVQPARASVLTFDQGVGRLLLLNDDGIRTRELLLEYAAGAHPALHGTR